MSTTKNLLLQLAAALFKQLQPLIADEIRKVLPDLVAAVKAELPGLASAVEKEIEKQVPTMVHAVVVAITTTLMNKAVDVENKVTDLIPGPVDDQILDPIMAQIRDRLGGLIG